MLVDIDSKRDNNFIIEELDEEHVLVKETKVAELKQLLQSVSSGLQYLSLAQLTNAR